MTNEKWVASQTPESRSATLAFATVHHKDGAHPAVVMQLEGMPWIELPSKAPHTEHGKWQSEPRESEPALADEEGSMSTRDRYIDARLAGIESKLDARMDAMQRFQEQAEARMERQTRETEERFERACQRHEAGQQTMQAAHRDLVTLIDNSRKHASNMAAVTIFGTIGGVLAAMALAITLGAGWLSDQSAWLRDSVNRIEQKVDAPAPISVQPQVIQDPAVELESAIEPEPPAAE